MNAAIITCTTPNRKWLYDLTNPSKVKYCKKYNYDYVFSTDKMYDKNMKPGWNKIQYILENLTKYDYVIWLDDDAGFIKFDEDVIAKAIEVLNKENKTMFICKDLAGLNSGVMIIKSNDFAKYMFTQIWEHRHLFKNNSHGYPGCMEQPAICTLCDIFTDEVHIGDGSIYNAYDKKYKISKPNQRTANSYILHIAAGSSWKERHKDLIKSLYVN